MAQGSRETLEQELEALLRQRDQYSLALDAATDPQASVRLQRTLDRLEDEIEGLREALAALPVPGMQDAPPPDWEDEPSTTIFDPEVVMSQPANKRRPPEPDEITQPMAAVPLDVPIAAAPRKGPSEESGDPARPLYDIEAEMQHARDVRLSATPPSVGGPARKYGAPIVMPARVPDPPVIARRARTQAPPFDPAARAADDMPTIPIDEPARRHDPPVVAPSPGIPVPVPSTVATEPPIRSEPGAAEPLPAVDPTVNVTPPSMPEARESEVLFAVDLPTVAWRNDAAQREAELASRLVAGGRDPLGPVVLDALEPPTGENPREEEPSDPFALPPPMSGTDWDRPFSATPTEEASPFGFTAVGPAAFDASTFTDPAPEAEWSAGSKILLAMVILGFLAAVGWVLTQ